MASQLINFTFNDTRALVYSSFVAHIRADSDTTWQEHVLRMVGKLPMRRPPVHVLIPILCLLIPIWCFVVYQLFLHPLARYPGPFWGKLTGARAAYHAWKGDIHLDMDQLHRRYGPYVRLSPNYLLFNTTEAIRDIYGHGKNMQKSRPYLAMVHNTPSTFTLLDKKEHAWKKRILSQRLSEASVREFEPAILELIDRFCANLCPSPKPQVEKTATVSNAGDASVSEAKGWSEPLNMSARCDHLFFDLITTLVFGENFDLIRSSWYHYVPEALARSNERISVIVQFPLVVWRRWDKILFRNSVAGRKDFLRFVHNLVTHRMKRASGNDVFASLLGAADPTSGKKLSRDEIVAESILMLVAGSDTSSTGLASMFFYLSRNTEKRNRLTREIRSKFSVIDEIRFGSQLNSCRYLQACLSECLRLTPPVAAAPFREVMKGGAMVDGHFVPEGTNIGTGIYSIQHNGLYFKDPYEFVPERWLREDSSLVPFNTEAHVPFMVGPRACLGKVLASSQSMLAMAHVCFLMDFEVVESMKDVGAGVPNAPFGRHRPGEYQLQDHITVARDGPYVQFRRRS